MLAPQPAGIRIVFSCLLPFLAFYTVPWLRACFAQNKKLPAAPSWQVRPPVLGVFLEVKRPAGRALVDARGIAWEEGIHSGRPADRHPGSSLQHFCPRSTHPNQPLEPTR